MWIACDIYKECLDLKRNQVLKHTLQLIHFSKKARLYQGINSSSTSNTWEQS